MSSAPIQVIVQSASGQSTQVLDVPVRAGAQGKTLRIQAQDGVKYQLKDMSLPGQKAPEVVKLKRVGKDLLIAFEEGVEAADVVLENYYSELFEVPPSLVGEGQAGRLYHYAIEASQASQAQSAVSSLIEMPSSVNALLSSAPVGVGSASAVGLAAFNLPALGISTLGVAAVSESAVIDQDTSAADKLAQWLEAAQAAGQAMGAAQKAFDEAAVALEEAIAALGTPATPEQLAAAEAAQEALTAAAADLQAAADAATAATTAALAAAEAAKETAPDFAAIDAAVTAATTAATDAADITTASESATDAKVAALIETANEAGQALATAQDAFDTAVATLEAAIAALSAPATAEQLAQAKVAQEALTVAATELQAAADAATAATTAALAAAEAAKETAPDFAAIDAAVTAATASADGAAATTEASQASTDAKVAALIETANEAGQVLGTAQAAFDAAEATLAAKIAALSTPATAEQLAQAEAAQEALTAAAADLQAKANAATAAIAAALAVADAAKETVPDFANIDAAVVAATTAANEAADTTAASETVTDAKVADLISAANAAGQELATAQGAFDAADTALTNAIAALGTPATAEQLAAAEAAQEALTVAATELQAKVDAAAAATAAALAAAEAAKETAPVFTAIDTAVAAAQADATGAATTTSDSEAIIDAKVAELVDAANAAGQVLGTAQSDFDSAETALTNAIAALGTPAIAGELAAVEAAQEALTAAAAELQAKANAATAATTAALAAAEAAKETAPVFTAIDTAVAAATTAVTEAADTTAASEAATDGKVADLIAAANEAGQALGTAQAAFDAAEATLASKLNALSTPATAEQLAAAEAAQEALTAAAADLQVKADAATAATAAALAAAEAAKETAPVFTAIDAAVAAAVTAATEAADTTAASEAATDGKVAALIDIANKAGQALGTAQAAFDAAEATLASKLNALSTPATAEQLAAAEAAQEALTAAAADLQAKADAATAATAAALAAADAAKETAPDFAAIDAAVTAASADADAAAATTADSESATDAKVAALIETANAAGQELATAQAGFDAAEATLTAKIAALGTPATAEQLAAAEAAQEALTAAAADLQAKATAATAATTAALDAAEAAKETEPDFAAIDAAVTAATAAADGAAATTADSEVVTDSKVAALIDIANEAGQALGTAQAAFDAAEATLASKLNALSTPATAEQLAAAEAAQEALTAAAADLQAKADAATAATTAALAAAVAAKETAPDFAAIDAAVTAASADADGASATTADSEVVTDAKVAALIETANEAGQELATAQAGFDAAEATLAAKIAALETPATAEQLVAAEAAQEALTAAAADLQAKATAATAATTAALDAAEAAKETEPDFAAIDAAVTAATAAADGAAATTADSEVVTDSKVAALIDIANEAGQALGTAQAAFDAAEATLASKLNALSTPATAEQLAAAEAAQEALTAAAADLQAKADAATAATTAALAAAEAAKETAHVFTAIDAAVAAAATAATEAADTTAASEAATDGKVAALIDIANEAGQALVTAQDDFDSAETALTNAIAALSTPATAEELAAAEVAQEALTAAEAAQEALTAAAAELQAKANAATAAKTAALAAAQAAKETAPVFTAIDTAVAAAQADVNGTAAITTDSEATTDAKVAELVTAANTANTALATAQGEFNTAEQALVDALAAMDSPAQSAQITAVQTAQAALSQAAADLQSAAAAAQSAMDAAVAAAAAANEDVPVFTNTAIAGDISAAEADVSAAPATLASATIETFAQSNGTSTAPTTDDYAALGLVGMGEAAQPSVAMVNSALADADITGTDADSRTDVQAIVDGYAAIVANADDAAATNPGTADYAAIGINGMDTAADANLLGDVIDTQAVADVDTVPKIQALADTVQAIMDLAALTGSTSLVDAQTANPNLLSDLTAQLSALGMTGVNAQNIGSIWTAIRDSADTGAGVDSLLKIQTLINNANDAPVNTVPGALTTLEDTPLVITGLSVSDADAGSSNVTVTLSVTQGTLNVAAGDNVVLGTNGTASVTLTGSVAAINTLLASSNAVTFTPTIHTHGDAILTMSTSDGGNTGSGGTLVDSDTVAITVTPVNDAPTASDKTITVVEDGSHTFTAADFGFSDSEDNPANTLVAIIITTLPGSGALTLNDVAVTQDQVIAVADIGQMLFTPAANANANGHSYASIGFKVQDNGGTDNGGADTSTAPNTLTFNVTSVNDAPTLDSSLSRTLVTASQDDAAPAPGQTLGSTLVSALLQGMQDIDASPQKGMAITGVNANGTLHYSLDAGATWLMADNPSVSHALLLPLHADTRVQFQPQAGFVGDLTDAITFKAWDQTSGSAGGYADTTASGGTSAFSATTDTVAVVITAPLAIALNNDTADNLALQTSDHRTADQTVNVTGLSAGDTWEYTTDGGQSWQTGSGNSFTLGDTARAPVWSIYQDGADLKIRSYIDGTPHFDLRIGSAGALSDITDLSNNNLRLVSDHTSHAGSPVLTDRVLQWTLWDHALQNPDSPTKDKRFNVTQAGDGTGAYQPTISVDVSREGIIDVWSTPQNQWQTPGFQQDMAALTRYEFLADGVVKVRHLVQVGDVSLNGTPGSLTNAYFENWLPFLKNAQGGFTGLALDLNAEGGVEQGYSALAANFPHYPSLVYNQTQGYAVAYNEAAPGSSPAIGVVFGTQASPDGRAALNTMRWDTGLGVLPSLQLQQTLQSGAVIDSSYYLVMRSGLGSDLKAQLDHYVPQATAPVVWQPSETPDSSTAALISALTDLRTGTATGSATDSLAPLVTATGESSEPITLPVTTSAGEVTQPGTALSNIGSSGTGFAPYDAQQVQVRLTNRPGEAANTNAWTVDTVAPVIGLTDLTVPEDWSANSLTLNAQSLHVQDASSTRLSSLSLLSVSGTGDQALTADDVTLVQNGDSWHVNLLPSGAHKSGVMLFDVSVSDAVGLSSTAQVRVNVAPVNDRPVGTAANLYHAATEDNTSAGQTVASLIAAHFTDADADASVQGMVIQWNQTTTAQGVWQYSANAGSQWQDLPANLASNNLTAALYLRATDLLRFVPAANFNGDSLPIYYRAVDNSFPSQAGGSTVNLLNWNNSLDSDSPISAGGGATVIRARVAAVNDAPTFSVSALGGNFTEGAGSAVGAPVYLFNAPTSSTGPSDEAGQKITQLTFTVSGLRDGSDEVMLLASNPVSLVDGVSGFTVNDTNLTLHNIAYSVSVSGDVATVTITPDLNNGQTAAQNLSGLINFVAGLRYRNDNADSPTPGDRVITLTSLSDNGGTLNGGIDTLTLSHTSTVTVVAVNDAPTHSLPGAQSVAEDQSLSIAGLSVSDVDANLATVRLSVLHGTVTVSLAGGASITDGNNTSPSLTLSGTASQINAALATLSYKGAANYNGADTLTILSTDSLGASKTDTVAITVTPVNDAPVVTVASNALPTLEDTAITFQIATQLSGKVTDVDNDPLQGIVIVQNTVAIGSGTWAWSSNGTDWTDFPTSYLGVIDWTQVMYLNASDSIRFTPATNYHGSSFGLLNFRAVDATLGTIASGTKINVNSQIGHAVSNQPGFFEPSITPVNDAPVLTVATTTPTFTEGSGSNQGNPVYLFNPLTYNTGPGNESAQKITSLTFTVSGLRDGNSEVMLLASNAVALVDGVSGFTDNINPMLDNIGYSVSVTGDVATVTVAFDQNNGLSAYDNLSGMANFVAGLRYRNDNVNNPTPGDRVITLTRLSDNGGTLNSGTDTVTLSHTSTVTVVALNDAPVLADATLAMIAVAQDAAVPTGSVGVLVSSLTGGGSDIDASPVKGMAITGVNVNGTLYFSTNGGSSWTAAAGISGANALLLGSDTDNRIYFKPNAGYHGTASDAVTFRAWDQTSGTEGTYASTATNGGTSAFSAATDTISQQVVRPVTINTVSTDSIIVMNEAVPLSGKADANATVTLDINGKQRTVLADGDGNWTYDSKLVPLVRYVMVRKDLSGDPFALSEIRVIVDGTNIANTLSIPITYGSGKVEPGAILPPPYGGLTDGSTSGGSYYETPYFTGEAWVELDLGGHYRVDSIELAPRGGWDGRLIGSKIYTSLTQQSLLSSAELLAASTQPTPTVRITNVTSGQFTATQPNATNEDPFINGANVITATQTVSGVTSNDTENVTWQAIAPGADGIAPVFTSGPTASVVENIATSTAVYDAQATDAGAGNDVGITYSLGGVDASKFDISATGVVTFKASPNFEAPTDVGGNNVHNIIVTAKDASNNASYQNVAITVTNINDAPIGTNKTITLLEEATRSFSAADFGFADAPGENHTLSAVVITALPAVGTLQLNGVNVALNAVIPVADLGALVYTPAINANGNTYASLGFQVRDSGGTNNGGIDTSVNTNTLTFNVTPINDAPVISVASLGGDFTEGLSNNPGAPVYLFDVLSIATGPFNESAQKLTQFTLTVSGLQDGANEVLLLASNVVQLTDGFSGVTSNANPEINNVAYSVSVSGGVATVTVTPTADSPLSAFVSLMEGLRYRNDNVNNPTPGDRVITLTRLSDNGGTLNSGTDTVTLSHTSTVTVVAVNDQPTFVSASAIALTGTEDTVFVQPISALLAAQVSDLDVGASLKGIAVNWNQAPSTQGVWAWSTDNVNWTDLPADITGAAATFNQPANALYLNASDYLRFTPASHFNGVVSPMLFRLADDTMPDTVSGTRVNVSHFNSASGPMSSAANGFALSLAAVNDAPVLATGSTLAYSENQPATAINTAITVADVDNATLGSGTVSITSGFVTGQDVLSLSSDSATMGNIAGVYDPATGVMTLTSSGSSATPAQWQAAFRAVQYSNTSDAPNTAARTVSFVVNDGAATSAPVTSTLSVTAVNDAPVLTTSSTLAYTENQPAAAINTAITVADADNATLGSGTVSITSGFVTGQDVLSLTNNSATMGNIAGVYDPATGVMTLTSSGSSATPAEWQSAFRAVQYRNTSESPNTAARTVSYVVNDDAANSAPVTSTISVTAVNDQPSFVSASAIALTGTEDTAFSVQISAALAGQISDPDDGASVKGIAISWNQAISAQGVWARSTDNSTWTNLPADITGSTIGFNHPENAVYLNASDYLRFTPTANYNGTVSPLFLRVADNTMPNTTSGTRLNVSDFNGPTGAMSAGPNNISLSLAATNDAPVISVASLGGDFTEGLSNNPGAPVYLFDVLSIATGPFNESSQKLTQFTLTVSGLQDGANEVLLLASNVVQLTDGFSGVTSNATPEINNVAYSVSVSGGVATITVTPTADSTLSAFVSLMEGLRYRNDNNGAIVPGTRVITLTSLSDNGGVASGGADTAVLNISSTVNVLPVVPTVASVTITSGTGIQSGLYNTGDVITTTVTFTEAVNVTGTPQITLNIGGTLVQANYAGGSGGTALTFTYTIQAGQEDADGISVNANTLALNGGTIKDLVGNNALLPHALVGDNASFKVDAVNLRTITPEGMDKNFSLSDDTASKWVVYTDGTTRGHNYYVSVAGAENLASVQMNLGNGWVNGVISGDKAVFHQSTPLDVGNLTASFRTTDLAGNVSAVTTQAMEVKDWSAIGSVHSIGAATFDVEETTVYNARYGTSAAQTFNLSKLAIEKFIDSTDPRLWLHGGATTGLATNDLDTLNITDDGAVLNVNKYLTDGFTVEKLRGFENIDLRSAGKQALVLDGISLGSISSSGWLSNAALGNGFYQMRVYGHSADTVVLRKGGDYDFTSFTLVNSNLQLTTGGISFGLYRNTTTKQDILIQTGVQVSYWQEGINKAPVNLGLGAQTAVEDTSTPIKGISVVDVDGNLASTQLTVLNGTLSVSLAGGASVSAGANNSATLTLSGTEAQINAALASLSYLGNANFFGTDTLTVVSTDAGGTPLSDSDSLSITVTSVNEAPTLQASTSTPVFVVASSTGVDLFSSVSANAGPITEAGQSITQIQLSVSGLADGADEKLVIGGTNVALTNGTTGTVSGVGYSVSVAGSTATVTITPAAGSTLADINNLVDGLQYRNTDTTSPTIGDRVVTLTSIKDNGGVLNGGVDETTLSLSSTAKVQFLVSEGDPVASGWTTTASGPLNATTSFDATMNSPLTGGHFIGTNAVGVMKVENDGYSGSPYSGYSAVRNTPFSITAGQTYNFAFDAKLLTTSTFSSIVYFRWDLLDAVSGQATPLSAQYSSRFAAPTISTDWATYSTTGFVAPASGNYKLGVTLYTDTYSMGSDDFVMDRVFLGIAPQVAPIVLDVNGDGTLTYSQAAMDVNGDGRLDQTAWAGAQDGVLVWDKHADGQVRDSSQYAFTQYGGKTDLEGLAAGFDSNADGVFDAADEKFAEFAVWQDANGNGVSDAGEVRSLSDVGIASIDLTSDGEQRNPAQGVSEAGRSTAQLADGTQMLVADAAFAYNELAYRINPEGELSLLGEQMDLHLSSFVNTHGAIHSVDLSGTGANRLSISLADVLGTESTLRVLGDADDSVVLDAAQWTAAGTAQSEGHSYAVYAAVGGQQLWLEQHIVMA